MIYRDECGRYLRKMEPYSIPALTRESHGKDYDRKRYATWQLERLDRQEPGKALAAAAGDEALTIAILDVFRATKLPRGRARGVDAGRRRRAARPRRRARRVDGLHHRPAAAARAAQEAAAARRQADQEGEAAVADLPRARRQRAPQGRQRAARTRTTRSTIRRSTTSDASTTKTEKIDLQDVTKRLFDYYDGERAKQEARAVGRGPGQGRRRRPRRPRPRCSIACSPPTPSAASAPRWRRSTLAWGKQLEDKQQWADAAAAYSKAHGLDPKGAAATERARRAPLHARQGARGPGQGRRPRLPPRRRAQARLRAGAGPPPSARRAAGRPIWMLYAAIVAAAARDGAVRRRDVRRRAA